MAQNKEILRLKALRSDLELEEKVIFAKFNRHASIETKISHLNAYICNLKKQEEVNTLLINEISNDLMRYLNEKI